MKARTNTTRWLLISFFVGLLAAAGLTFAYHHGVPTLAKANGLATPTPAVLQTRHETLIAASGGPHTLTDGIHWVAPSSYSDTHTPDVTDSRSDSHSNAATGSDTGSSNHAGDQTSDTAGAPQPQTRPATTGTNHVPPAGSGDFAYQIHSPLGCEMPAGCGVVGGNGYVPPQTSGTSGGLSAVRTAQNSGNDDQNPPPNNNTPVTNDSGQSPPGSAPPNQTSDPPAAAAPELDAATLAGAVTLLLGALTALRGRRPARASR